MVSESATSKSEILRRIERANGGASEGQAVAADWETISRAYKRRGSLGAEAVLQLFEGRLRDYDATVTRCDASEVARRVQERLTALDKRRVVVPHGFPPEWLPAGFDFVFDEALSAAELDQMDGVITASTVAIAETGTMVLQNVPGQGRRAVSLVPDYHLCVVRAEDVVETVAEAIMRLKLRSAIATTFISGPSATADIEMTRIKGVHGPRVLDVLLVLD